MKMTRVTLSNHNRQHGIILLASTMVLLLICFIATQFVVRSMTIHHQIISGDYRSNQAFEAAEGGMEYAMAYLNANPHDIVQDSNSDGVIDPNPNPLTSNLMPVPLTTGSFSVQYKNPEINKTEVIEITSIGKSKDGMISKTVNQQVYFKPIISNLPDVPLTAYENVSISGNVTIANPSGPSTIEMGGAIDLDGSAKTKPTPGSGSDKNVTNADVTENAFPSLSHDAFFLKFFSATPAEIKKSVDHVYTNNDNTNYSSTLNGVTGESIWLEQTAGSAIINGPVSIGSEDKPVLLIVDGDFKINGNITLYGMLYVTGDWYNDGGGTATVNGAIIVGGNFESKGTPDINYRTAILDNIEKLGPFNPIPGSWKDF